MRKCRNCGEPTRSDDTFICNKCERHFKLGLIATEVSHGITAISNILREEMSPDSPILAGLHQVSLYLDQLIEKIDKGE